MEGLEVETAPERGNAGPKPPSFPPKPESPVYKTMSSVANATIPFDFSIHDSTHLAVREPAVVTGHAGFVNATTKSWI
jgi:hypothetical protein